MTRTIFLFASLLILQFQVTLADTKSATLLSSAVADITHPEKPMDPGMPQQDPLSHGLGWMIDHSHHLGGKFHHEEDGKLHGFCFDKMNRRHWLTSVTCICLKCVLVFVHLALILVAFVHHLH